MSYKTILVFALGIGLLVVFYLQSDPSIESLEDLDWVEGRADSTAYYEELDDLWIYMNDVRYFIDRSENDLEEKVLQADELSIGYKAHDKLWVNHEVRFVGAIVSKDDTLFKADQ